MIIVYNTLRGEWLARRSSHIFSARYGRAWLRVPHRSILCIVLCERSLGRTTGFEPATTWVTVRSSTSWATSAVMVLYVYGAVMNHSPDYRIRIVWDFILWYNLMRYKKSSKNNPHITKTTPRKRSVRIIERIMIMQVICSIFRVPEQKSTLYFLHEWTIKIMKIYHSYSDLPCVYSWDRVSSCCYSSNYFGEHYFSHYRYLIGDKRVSILLLWKPDIAYKLWLTNSQRRMDLIHCW